MPGLKTTQFLSSIRVKLIVAVNVSLTSSMSSSTMGITKLCGSLDTLKFKPFEMLMSLTETASKKYKSPGVCLFYYVCECMVANNTHATACTHACSSSIALPRHIFDWFIIIVASLSKPHINHTAVLELHVYDGTYTLVRSIYHCTEGACNVLWHHQIKCMASVTPTLSQPMHARVEI